MNATKFLSAETYVVLPTKANPRVFLSISNSEMARLSFELYNPFSKKAKVFKAVTKFICVYCNPLARLVIPTIQFEKSDFIEFLEKNFKKKIVNSLYVATAKDKVVLQLQDDNGVLGYLKFPITSLGEQRLLNELKAIKILSKLCLVPKLLFDNTYYGTPFIVLQNQIGAIGHVNQQEYKTILDKFKKDKSFKLVNHPRVINLKNKLKIYDLDEISNRLNNLISSSKNTYLEVFEHGDFAPWNLIKNENGIIPFDFEYFEECGLEYLDEFKYYFQIENLLNKRIGLELIKTLKSILNIKEFNIILQVFLIKEIVNKHGANESYEFENSLLKNI